MRRHGRDAPCADACSPARPHGQKGSSPSTSQLGARTNFLRSQWDADMIRLSYLLPFEPATGQPGDDGRNSFQTQCIVIRGGTGCLW